MEEVLRVPVRWKDFDVLGHVNQSVYHEYLEEARVALLRRAGDPKGFVLAHVELDYLHEIDHTATAIEIAVQVAEVGTSSVRIDHEVRLPSGTLAARGHSVEVAWDQSNRRKRHLTEAEKHRLLSATTDRT